MIIKLSMLATLLVFTFIGVFGQEATPTPEKQAPADPASQDREKGDAEKKAKGGVVNGAAIRLPKPVYPRAARAERAAGKISVNVLINEEGVVFSAKAVSGHPLLCAAAEEAAKRALFIPTTLSGKPVKVAGIISYNFIAEPQLDDKVMDVAAWIVLIRANQPPKGMLMTDVLRIFPSKVPTELGVEPTLFDDLAAASETERAEVLARIADAVKANLTNEEKWHFNLGTHLANILVEVITLMQIDGGNITPQNLEKINSELRQVTNLLASLPPESQPEIIDRFDRIPEFSKHDLRDKARLQALWTSITAHLF